MTTTASARRSLGARDRQEFPFLMIPKAFFTRFKPSWKATMAYVALKYYTHGPTKSCEHRSHKVMADTVGISEATLKRGIRELVKAGAVTMKRRSRKSPSGDRIPLPNLYEIVNLDLSATGGPGDAI